MLFDKANNIGAQQVQRSIDDINRLREQAVIESMLLAVRLANAVLDLRFQKDTSKMVEITRSNEVIFRGRTGQEPEIDKLSAGDFDLLKQTLTLPAESELEGFEDTAITVGGKTVFAVVDQQLKVNKLLTPEQTRVLDTAEVWLDRRGERSENGDLRFSGRYTIERTEDNLRIAAKDGRPVVDTASGLFDARPEDYEAFAQAREDLDGRSPAQQPVSAADLER